MNWGKLCLLKWLTFFICFFSLFYVFFSGTHVRTVRTSGYAPTIIGDAVQCKMFMKFMNLCQISFLLDWTMQNLEQKKKGFNNIPIILTYSALTVTVPPFWLTVRLP